MEPETRKMKVRERKRRRTLAARAQTGVPRRLAMLKKAIYQRIRWRRGEWTSIGLIVGCQRSGTTMMTQLFDANLATWVFNEFSELSSRDTRYGIRLNPLEEVARAFQRLHAPIIVLKPLVETQRVDELLTYFRSSRAIFMYRDYRDVVASNLKRFGADNGRRNLQPIVLGDRTNWRAERVSDHVKATIRRCFTDASSHADSAALFWYARNSLYFDLGLDTRKDVLLCRYEELVAHPQEVMNRMYQFLGWCEDSPAVATRVHGESLRKGRGIELTPEIDELCLGLLGRLDEAHHPGSNPST